MHHCQSQARAFSVPFGCEVRVKYFFHDLGRHSMSGIPNQQPYVFTRRKIRTAGVLLRSEGNVLQADGQCAAVFLHGMQTVGTEIDNQLMDLGRIGQYKRGGGNVLTNFDCFGCGCPQHLYGFSYDQGDLHRLFCLVFLAAEGQYLTDQLTGSM